MYWVLEAINPTLWLQIAPATTFLLATTSLLLNLQTGFLFDTQYDAINLWCLRGFSLLEFVSIRLILIYLFISLPISTASIFIGIILHLPFLYSVHFFFVWSLASWVMIGLGVIIAAITPILRIRSNLLALINIPLYIPIILFSIGAIYHYQQQEPYMFELYMLKGLALFGVILFPCLLKTAIKIGVDS
jgi:heme exporter protein B